MRRGLILLCLFCSQLVFALDFEKLTSSVNVPGNATTSYEKQWTPFHNPSALSMKKGAKKASFSLSYNNYFTLKEFSSYAASASMFTKYIDVGVAFSRFGFSEYNENIVGLAVSRKFANRFTIAIQGDYCFVSIPKTEGTHGVFLFELGTMVDVYKGFSIGFHAFNPILSSIQFGTNKIEIPSIYSLGFSYEYLQYMTFLLQIDQQVFAPTRFKIGMEYDVNDFFVAKIGFQGFPAQPMIGFSAKYIGIQLDAKLEWYTSLGVNTGCRLSYSF